MQTSAETRDRLVRNACEALGELGLADLTVGAVARRARVSTALVHYHFETKERLLRAAAGRLLPERSRGRLAAIARPGGLEALDALWDTVEAGVSARRERAFAELLLHAPRDERIAALLDQHRAAELRAIAARAPLLLAELGAELTAGADEFATLLVATLDGCAAALLAGAGPGPVRAAYDAFWLTTIAAGQPSRR